VPQWHGRRVYLLPTTRRSPPAPAHNERKTAICDASGHGYRKLLHRFSSSHCHAVDQRCSKETLAAHPDVATAGEPWLLLPILVARRTGGTYSVYRHEDAALAMDEFVRNLPEGTVAFDRALRGFVTDLYRASAGSEPQFFVDKTPRYHLIAHDLIHLFPQAKFIYLWRNPISVATSMMRTWGEGRWNLFRYRIDLEYGPGNLLEAYLAHADTAIAIQYESSSAIRNQSPNRCSNTWGWITGQRY
jgi:Sulfotransferase family